MSEIYKLKLILFVCGGNNIPASVISANSCNFARAIFGALQFEAAFAAVEVFKVAHSLYW